MMKLLRHRETCGPLTESLSVLPKDTKRCIDRRFEGLLGLLERLDAALDKGDVEETTVSMRELTHRLLESPMDTQLPQVNQKVLATRDAFVMVGGPSIVTRVFEPPFAPGDARNVRADRMRDYQEIWNDALVLLREVCYTHPDISEAFCRKHLVVFFFSLLAHRTIFDTAVSIIEELFAIQPCVFQLSEVPRLHDLLRNLSCRQLAVFCRVLALLVYEPEDRQMMENTKVMKSRALLQLRRDRASRTSSVIDANQATLCQMVDMLPRLVTILRIVNHAPPLEELSNYQQISHLSQTHDLFYLLSNLVDEQDWAHWDNFLGIVDDARARSGGAAEDDDDGASSTDSFVAGAPIGSQPSVFQLLRPIFNGGTGGGAGAAGAVPSPPANTAELNDVHMRVMNAAESLGMHYSPSFLPARGAAQNFYWRPHRRPTRSTPADAVNALQLHALILLPFQVEVLFVLSTMLQGRRKADVQRRMLAAGAPEMLTTMFDRLSWDAPPPPPPPAGASHGIHGPGCECNPESSLRVQFLRLVHAFCDRDASGNAIKWALLSDGEAAFARRYDTDGADAARRAARRKGPRGLVVRIAEVLMGQPGDSMYKFWLSTCVEAFLRGSTLGQQMVLCDLGMLDYLVDEVMGEGLRCAGSLQTAFDLLGELCKGNEGALEGLDALLEGKRLATFLRIVSRNLVDSNVFLRSLVFTAERLSAGADPAVASPDPAAPPQFLTASWADRGARYVRLAAPEEWARRTGRDWAAPQLPSPRRHRGVDAVAAAPPPLPPPPGEAEGAQRCAAEEVVVRASALGSAEPWWRLPAKLGRFGDFLCEKLAVLLRDLISVVDIADINHENICCLNSALALCMLARRRGQLAQLLGAVRILNEQASVALCVRVEACSLDAEAAADDAMEWSDSDDEDVDLEHMNVIWAEDGALEASGARVGELEDRAAGCGAPASKVARDETSGKRRHDARRRRRRKAFPLLNFRELLWFWQQYYHHRGRDRLTLEFSSHIRFEEWNATVELLAADDGSPCALMDATPKLPRSPFHLEARPSSFKTLDELEGAFDDGAEEGGDGVEQRAIG